MLVFPPHVGVLVILGALFMFFLLLCVAGACSVQLGLL